MSSVHLTLKLALEFFYYWQTTLDGFERVLKNNKTDTFITVTTDYSISIFTGRAFLALFFTLE